MSSQVDGHDEARELRSFGYEQQLSRSMGVFSSPVHLDLKAVIRP